MRNAGGQHSRCKQVPTRLRATTVLCSMLYAHITAQLCCWQKRCSIHQMLHESVASPAHLTGACTMSRACLRLSSSCSCCPVSTVLWLWGGFFTPPEGPRLCSFLVVDVLFCSSSNCVVLRTVDAIAASSPAGPDCSMLALELHEPWCSTVVPWASCSCCCCCALLAPDICACGATSSGGDATPVLLLLPPCRLVRAWALMAA